MGTLFDKEEATPTVLSFLRETKVSRMVSMVALGGGGGVEEGSGVTRAEIKQSGRVFLRCLAQLWRGDSHVLMAIVKDGGKR